MSTKLSIEKINNNLEKWGSEKNIQFKLINYCGNKSEIFYECKKCGNIGRIKYYNIQQGYGCRKCGIKKRAESRRKYTKEYCIKIANNYTSLKDFYTKEKIIYNICVKNKWLDEVTKKLIRSHSLKERCLYGIYFPNNIIYIGLTHDFSRRISQHLMSKGSVYDYIKNHNIQPIKIKQLTPYMNAEKIQIYEQKTISFFQWLGFTLLNKNRGGSLGQVLSHITKDECIKILKTINYDIRIFKNKYKKHYNKCIKEQWLSELIPNYVKTKIINLTKDECKKIALKYNTRIEFYKNETSVYSYAQRNSFLNYILSDLPNKRQKQEIEQYSIDGRYINTYKSLNDVKNSLNITSVSGIIGCCYGKQFNSYNYQWKYKNSDKIIKTNHQIERNFKRVYQIDNEKNIIAVFNSIIEANEKTNINKSSISSCCNKKRKRAGKYIWIFESDFSSSNLEYYFSEENHSFIKTVYQYTLNGNLINEYDNTVEASKHTLISRTAINNCLKKRSKSAGGYIWSYKILTQNIL